MSIREFFLNLFFPKSCLFCRREGDYLCPDCFSILEILEYHYCLCKEPLRLPEAGKCRKCQKASLNGLYFALSYQNLFCQKLIKLFKYGNAVKELSKPLALLIIHHFQLSGKGPRGEILIPLPLTRSKQKLRGFNQSEEIAKELSNFLSPVRDSKNREGAQKEDISNGANGVKIPLINDVLMKIKETLPQVELEAKARVENPKGAFLVKNEARIKGKKILLVDDVYTTGATIEECARVLKEAGAKEVWGIVVARG